MFDIIASWHMALRCQKLYSQILVVLQKICEVYSPTLYNCSPFIQWFLKHCSKVENWYRMVKPISCCLFYTPWKHQKTFDFLMFSGGIEKDHWHEMV